ncbi:hypothetical protein SY89_01241 [Halolamina pelagica]|uniref:TmcA/NAT10 N-terminal domain-containing protein n=1 Tax=Halolamina pelagica TaxID=699431 RepID=A0A0P7GYE5_9EURY|nr:hypothetical protein SY89_01241 [Halolamina pelagica]
MTLSSLAPRLHAEAERANERRALVLAGPPEATRAAAVDAIEAAGLPLPDCTAVSAAADWPFEHVGPRHSRDLLGRTQQAIVVDGHDECSPNAIGRTVGAVDGGGLYLLLAPDLDSWPDRRDGFDESLAVPPFGVEDVAGNFRARLVATLRAHPGTAICEVDEGYDDPEGDAVEVRDDGLTDPRPARPREPPNRRQTPCSATRSTALARPRTRSRRSTTWKRSELATRPPATRRRRSSSRPTAAGGSPVPPASRRARSPGKGATCS